jgi:hypothetical protein
LADYKKRPYPIAANPKEARVLKTSVIVLAGILVMASGAGAAEPKTPAIDPKADAVLKQMGQALSSAKSFTFETHSTTQDILENGQKVEFARNGKFSVRRPDRVAAAVVGDFEELDFIYDGKTVTLFNRKSNSYGVADAKPSIDATCDLLAEQYGMVLPLADFLFADPYKTMIASVRSGQHLGDGYVLDTKCHHLAFRQEAVDWQIWIDQSAQKPLPRKIVITYKETPAQLQYTAFFNNWNLSANIPDDRFAFKTPEGAKKVDFARPAPAAGNAPKQP